MIALSLKYRIAVVIVALVAVVLTLALGATLARYTESSREQWAVAEAVQMRMLGNASRVALFTGEYDELQPYIEQVTEDPHILRALVVDQNDRVVVSSDVTEVGARLPPLPDDANRFWRTLDISNESGRLGMLAVNFSHAELAAANDAAMDLGVVIALFGMVFIAVVGLFIGHLLTRRLHTVAAVAQRFANGDLSARAHLEGADEIAVLGKVFDEMSANIESHIASLQATESELRQARNDLERRVAERTAELAEARDHALEASRTKSTFLANMSHELRTPLNAIIGYSEMLEEEASEAGFDAFAPDLLKIKNAGHHLLSLINDILDLSKIEAGKMDLILSEFEVAPLVNEVISTVQPQATQKGNALTVSCDPHLGTMRSDAVKVRQVLINLLSNANKFTERGSIHIAAQRTRVGPADWVEFTVRDSGIGIAPQKLEKLFTEFYQADPSATRKYGGSGLGLAISRRFCQMMGGDITVDSRVDVGSTFRALLPVEVKEPVQPKERSAPPDVATADEPESRVAVDPRVVRLAANPRKGNVEHNRRKRVPRVLVIDDDPGARDLLIRFLNRQGCVVEVARSGDEGLEMARKLRPDLITLDVVMPGLNGWEVLQELKKDVDIAHIPVIMLTMTDEKLLGYSLGAAHFLSKPLDRGMFMEVLTRLLRQSPRS